MGLRNYVLKRIIQAIPVIFIIATLNFVMINLAPGDPALLLAGQGFSYNEEYLETLRIKFGLDKPLHIRLGIYLSNLIRGDFGKSYVHKRPAIEVIVSRMFPTFLLMGTSTLFAVIFGMIAGTISAKNFPSKKDSFLTTIIIGLQSLPPFWTGMILILVFSIYLGWLPTGGMVDPLTGGGFWDLLNHLLLPSIVLFIGVFPAFFLITRSSVIETTKEDYITTARASGLSERTIFLRHALKNAIIPPVTSAGLLFGTLLFGSIIVESLFSWPGLGLTFYTATMARDYPLITGIFVIISIMFLTVNIIMDIVNAYLDPRISFE